MKKRNRILIYPFIIMGFLLIVTNSCKKDEPALKKDPIITWPNPADITYGTLLSATQLNATADVSGTFVYTPAIGTKLNEGTNQNLKVDFTPTDAATYNAASKTVKINVNAKKNPIITWANPVDIAYGTLLSATQLNATADAPGAFVYIPAIGSKLNEGANQDLKVDFTPTDAINYNSTSKTVKINVTASLTGTVTDIDGNVYKTVKIGSQWWMAENLKVTKYRNGDVIGTTTPSTLDISSESTPKYQWAYNGNESNVVIYGRLYTWYAATDSRNVCPTGWHLPTDSEWSTISIVDEGGKLKEIGTTHWTSPNTGATDEYGFKALPGGGRGVTGAFTGMGVLGGWWNYAPINVGVIKLSYDNNYTFTMYWDKSCGFSVRCVKD